MKNSKQRKSFTEEVTGTVSEIIKQVRKLIKKGNARRILIKDKNGKTLFQSQLTIGIAGTAAFTAMAPIISAISTFALMMNDVKIIVEKYPEEQSPEDRDEYEDDYEVEADFIEIRDEEEEEGGRDKGDSASSPTDSADKTVGKKDDMEDDK